VTTVLPGYSGTVAVHEAVPEATPESPVDVVQRTSRRPISSEALPAIAIVAAEVETTVVVGDVIRIDGGVRSDEDVDGGGGGGVTGGVTGSGTVAGGSVIVGCELVGGGTSRAP
jgi:hypothetical protein